MKTRSAVALPSALQSSSWTLDFRLKWAATPGTHDPGFYQRMSMRVRQQRFTRHELSMMKLVARLNFELSSSINYRQNGNGCWSAKETTSFSLFDECPDVQPK
jgi:hypothetical protein